MEEKSRAQELSVREISLIRELAQIRKEHKRELVPQHRRSACSVFLLCEWQAQR